MNYFDYLEDVSHEPQSSNKETESSSSRSKEQAQRMNEYEYNQKQKQKHLKIEIYPYKIAFVLTAGLVFTIFNNDFRIFKEYADIVSDLKVTEPRANAIFMDSRDSSRSPVYLVKLENEQSMTIEELFARYQNRLDKIFAYVKQPLLLPMVNIK